jgi:hypothetical protein
MKKTPSRKPWLQTPTNLRGFLEVHDILTVRKIVINACMQRKNTLETYGVFPFGRSEYGKKSPLLSSKTTANGSYPQRAA